MNATSDLSLAVSVGSCSFSATGDKATVLGAYEEFKKDFGSQLFAAGAMLRQDPGGGGKPAEGLEKRESVHTTTLPLKPYLARLDMRGNKEKATALIAWAGESGSQTSLTVSEIDGLWKRSPFKTPGNLARDVRSAEAEGWLDSEGTSGSSEVRYSINGYGEEIVAGWTKSPEE
jgi:hypothetical protein